MKIWCLNLIFLRCIVIYIDTARGSFCVFHTFIHSFVESFVVNILLSYEARFFFIAVLFKSKYNKILLFLSVSRKCLHLFLRGYLKRLRRKEVLFSWYWIIYLIFIFYYDFTELIYHLPNFYFSKNFYWLNPSLSEMARIRWFTCNLLIYQDLRMILNWATLVLGNAKRTKNSKRTYKVKQCSTFV